MRLFALLMFACALALIPALQPAVAKDPVILVEDENKAMQQAIKNARNSLDYFLKLAATPAAGSSTYSLKVAIRDGEHVEHMWLTPFKQQDGKFVGMVNNDPRYVKNVKLGQPHSFTRDKISDWMYRKDGKLHGGFTTRALFAKMPKSQVDAYSAMFAANPDR